MVGKLRKALDDYIKVCELESALFVEAKKRNGKYISHPYEAMEKAGLMIDWTHVQNDQDDILESVGLRRIEGDFGEDLTLEMVRIIKDTLDYCEVE